MGGEGFEPSHLAVPDPKSICRTPDYHDLQRLQYVSGRQRSVGIAPARHSADESRTVVPMRPILAALFLLSAPVLAEPRFQVVQIAPGRAILLDTATGTTWETCEDKGWCQMQRFGSEWKDEKRVKPKLSAVPPQQPEPSQAR